MGRPERHFGPVNIPSGIADALAGRYRLEREIGAGGMATVYLARDLKHDRDVAIKVLRPELAQSLTAERFVREIAILGGDVSKFVAPSVLQRLHDKVQERQQRT